MRSNVTPCQLNDNAESVALKMWEHQLKDFPIVDNEHKIIGIISDTDICKYSVMKHKPIWELNIRDIYQHCIFYTCYQNDSSKTVLNILIKNHLQWLSVTNQQQQFMGIIGLSDIISKQLKHSNVIKLNPVCETKKLKVHT
jgi:predicted transcriptional regulator